MKKSIFLFAASMMVIIAAKAQTAPKVNPAKAPSATQSPVPSNTGVQAPAQTPATRPAQGPTHTPAAPARRAGLPKARVRATTIAKPAPRVAKEAQKVEQK